MREGVVASMLSCRAIDSIPALRALADEWRGLLDRSSAPEVVSTPAWMLTWLEHYADHDSRRIRFIAVRDGDRLVGLAPMIVRWMRYRRVVPLRCLELVGTGERECEETCSDYVGILSEQGREREVAEAVARAIDDGCIGALDHLRFARMSSAAEMTTAWADALAARGWDVRTRAAGRCPVARLEGDWETYLGSLTGHARRVVRTALRDFKRWADEPGYTLRETTPGEDWSEAKRILYDLHAERWRGEGKEGVFGNDCFRAFHDDVMAKLDGGKDGLSEIVWLEVGGRPVAVGYAHIYAGRVCVYQTGRTCDLPKKVKIGVVFHALAIERAIKKGYREYDFLNGETQYKRQFSSGYARELITIDANPPRPGARVTCAAEKIVDFAAERTRAWRRQASEWVESAKTGPKSR